MSKITCEKKKKKKRKKRIGETKYKNLKKQLTVDEAKTEIGNKIITKINKLLDDQS